jgi:hypothetical protein
MKNLCLVALFAIHLMLNGTVTAEMNCLFKVVNGVDIEGPILSIYSKGYLLSKSDAQNQDFATERSLFMGAATYMKADTPLGSMEMQSMSSIVQHFMSSARLPLCGDLQCLPEKYTEQITTANSALLEMEAMRVDGTKVHLAEIRHLVNILLNVPICNCVAHQDIILKRWTYINQLQVAYRQIYESGNYTKLSKDSARMLTKVSRYVVPDECYVPTCDHIANEFLQNRLSFESVRSLVDQHNSFMVSSMDVAYQDSIKNVCPSVQLKGNVYTLELSHMCFSNSKLIN